jgi:hypothetical protein
LLLSENAVIAYLPNTPSHQDNNPHGEINQNFKWRQNLGNMQEQSLPAFLGNWAFEKEVLN